MHFPATVGMYGFISLGHFVSGRNSRIHLDALLFQLLFFKGIQGSSASINLSMKEQHLHPGPQYSQAFKGSFMGDEVSCLMR